MSLNTRDIRKYTRDDDDATVRTDWQQCTVCGKLSYPYIKHHYQEHTFTGDKGYGDILIRTCGHCGYGWYEVPKSAHGYARAFPDG